MAGEEIISTGTIRVGKEESFWPWLFSRAGSVGALEKFRGDFISLRIFDIYLGLYESRGWSLCRLPNHRRPSKISG